LLETCLYIASDNPDAVYRWVEKIEETCELLAVNPQVGQQRETHGLGKCRAFTCGNDVIFFRAAPDGVEIIRIVRAERDIDRL
jgi:toxin ParE1/3/4